MIWSLLFEFSDLSQSIHKQGFLTICDVTFYVLNSFTRASHVTFSHSMYIFECTNKFHRFTFSQNCVREDLWLTLNNTLLLNRTIASLYRTGHTATLAHHAFFTQDRHPVKVVWVGSVYFWATVKLLNKGHPFCRAFVAIIEGWPLLRGFI